MNDFAGVVPKAPTRWYRILYVQVIVAVILGVAVGALFPDVGKSLKPLADGFIQLVKMLIGPIIFCTVVHGIASVEDLSKLGRIGLKAFVYFELVSTLALLIGLLVVNVLQPGVGITAEGKTYQTENVAKSELNPLVTPNPLVKKPNEAFLPKEKGLSKEKGLIDFVLNIIPNTILSAFVSGDLLQVLLVSILIAFSIIQMGEKGKVILQAVDSAGDVFFGVMRIVIRLAPIGAFGAMGYTVGAHGLDTLGRLAALMLGFYLTSALFVLVVLGSVARWSGFSILSFLSYLKEELLLVLGTSSSETALPRLIEKLKRLGCSQSTVGLVVPTGYSFNLDGTNIYMAMSVVFLAQATNTPLDWVSQVGILLIAMLTSKGASGVTGAGFVTLAATLQAVPAIPMESLALLIGIDRFMSECRALTNFIGNAVATVAISRWERELTAEQLQTNLASCRRPVT